MMDNLAADTNVRELMTQPINILLVLGAVAFVSFGGSQYFIPLAAARLAKRLRSEYLNSLLMQDQAFFDEKGKSGEVTLLFSDDIADLQAGLSVKFSGECGPGLAAVMPCSALSSIVVGFRSFSLTLSDTPTI